jgi:AcrR family transcriptional regulator
VATIGRPRDPSVDDAAIDAAIRLIVEDGFSSLTMERVAERAGVSKAALYRRWANKTALVADAVEWLSGEAAVVPDTGGLRADMVEYVERFSRDRHADVEVFDAIRAAVMSEPELMARCRDVLLAHGAAAFQAMVERAVARGELPASTDVELMAEVAPALLLYHHQTTGQKPDAAFMERIVRQFFSPGPSAGGGGPAGRR